MKKIIALILICFGSAFLHAPASAQFTSATSTWQVHYSAPTKWVNYKNTIVYIGAQWEEFDLGFQQNFDKQQTLLEEIFISDNKNFSENDIASQIIDNIDIIKATKTLIINTSNFDILLQLLGKMNATDTLNLKNKTLYLATNSNKFFLKRILAKQIKSIGIDRIYTISQDKLLNFLSTLSLGKITNDESYITPFSLSFQETPKYLVISYLIDSLIYHGFPIELITMFLILSLGALVISIFRQIVGFSIFGIYSPLLFAVSLSVLWIPLSMTLLGIGLITKLLMRLFTKRIYLLHNAKTSLLVMLYFFILLMVLGLNTVFNFTFINMDIFTNGFVILPILFIIIVSDKIYNEGFKLFSKWRRVAFAEFLLVSFAVYGLLYRTVVKHILLAFPELLLLIFILNIAVWRFTGLQLLEYFRFMPLIKKSSESEEE